MYLNKKCKLLQINSPLIASLNYCMEYMLSLRHYVGQINVGLKNLAKFLGLREGKSLLFKDKLTSPECRYSMMIITPALLHVSFTKVFTANKQNSNLAS